MPRRLGYSAAALAGSINRETHLLRRLRPSRYIASNSAAGKECVEGRASSASIHAFSRGYFSMRPSFFDPVEEGLGDLELDVGL